MVVLVIGSSWATPFTVMDKTPVPTVIVFAEAAVNSAATLH
jgi:hypothetical protein